MASADIWVVVGLGNPGAEYEGTRHNIGFAVIDTLAEKTGIALRRGKGQYLIGSRHGRDHTLTLLKPMTFMNNSGEAVEEICLRSDVPHSRLVVVVDDFQLPLGALRLRPKGSDGGHNGLASLIAHLGTGEFPRIRCGIGGVAIPEDKGKSVEFVLSPFTRAELPVVRNMVASACDAVLTTAEHGFETAMNRFNRRHHT